MTLKITRQIFADYKTALRELCPELRSSHADEALAAACGYRTYASLTAAFAAVEQLDVPFDNHRLLARLGELGYQPNANVPSDLFRHYIELQHLRIFKGLRSRAIRAANDNSSP